MATDNDYVNNTIRKTLYLESSEILSRNSQPITIFCGSRPPRVKEIDGVSGTGLKHPEAASLHARYNQEYVHVDETSRRRYGEDYAKFACRYPNILPLPMFSIEGNTRVVIVPRPSGW